MKNWSPIAMERAGWPSSNIEAEVKRGERMYNSMASLLGITKPLERGVKDSYQLVNFLVKRRDIISIQEARLLLQKDPSYFMKNSSVVVPGSGDVEDAEDYVFRSNGLYLKASKLPGNITIIKEAFIGTILNRLRAHTPNFACITGAWKWYRPIVFKKLYGTDYEFVFPSDSSLITEWLAYEEITGETLRDHIKTHGGAYIRNILWQIGIALKKAYQEFGFQHRDLHVNNVIVSPQHHRFIFSRGLDVRYCDINAIAVIIDYGRSSCVYDGAEYSKWWVEEESTDIETLLESVLSLEDYMNQSDTLLIREMLTNVKTSQQSLDIIISTLAPQDNIYIYDLGPTKALSQLSTSRQIRSARLNISDDSSDEELISYGGNLLSLLQAGDRTVKNLVLPYLDIIDRMSYKKQVIEDLYVSLIKYK